MPTPEALALAREIIGERFNNMDLLPMAEALDRFAAQRGAELYGGERYRHKKRGTTYQVIGVASSQVVGEPIGEGSQAVVYRSEDDGSLWVRPYDEFHDGRFEQLPLTDTQADLTERARGTMECPVCMYDQPHDHREAEQRDRAMAVVAAGRVWRHLQDEDPTGIHALWARNAFDKALAALDAPSSPSLPEETAL
jgi:hypothetical protein